MHAKIYYRKDPMFREDDNLTASDVKEERTHGLITILSSCDRMNDLFEKMQGEFMPTGIKQRIGDARKRLGVDFHTSMSVGDCIVDIPTGTVFECCRVGWRVVPESL